MPRQLPWKSNGSRTQTVKPPSHPSKASRIPDDIDGDFFDGTVLASSKGKVKVKAKAASGSDDSLSDLLAEPSTPRTKKARNVNSKERAPSSSPPPLADYTLSHTEPMRKGVSKFDLRDDEWMMVEDEFLETAKLFTRHLHIAEYDRLKAIIEAKKKEAEVARPVVAGAKRSAEGAMKERAKVQDNKQRKAIRDVFASQGCESEEDRAPHRSKSSRSASTITKPRPDTSRSRDTDSDDLDAPRVPKPKIAVTIPATVTRPSSPLLHVSKLATSSFAKPALPAPARPRARVSRMTPFDMLDEYTPPRHDPKPRPTLNPTTAISNEGLSNSSKPRSQSTSSSPLPQPSHTTSAKPTKPRLSLELLDEWGATAETGVSNEVGNSIARRRTERARERQGKKEGGATNLEDIPTFLF